MKKYSATYQIASKVTAIILLMAFLIPSGVQSKHMLDFCMMEMGHHAEDSMKADSGHTQTAPLTGDHCDTGPSSHESNQADHTHNHCDPGLVCACSMGQVQLSDTEWIPATKKIDTRLTRQNDLPPFYSGSEKPDSGQQISIGEYAPPLWLLYDTFLM